MVASAGWVFQSSFRRRGVNPVVRFCVTAEASSEHDQATGDLFADAPGLSRPPAGQFGRAFGGSAGHLAWVKHFTEPTSSGDFSHPAAAGGSRELGRRMLAVMYGGAPSQIAWSSDAGR